MVTKVALILTPNVDFGEIVRQSLVRVDSLAVKVFSSLAELRNSLHEIRNVHYALMDMDAGNEEVLQQGLLLRGKFPSLRLTLISKIAPPSELDEIRPWGILKKPFSQRDLFSLFRAGNENIREDPEVIDLQFSKRASEEYPAWLEDECQAAQTLQKAIEGLDMQEAMVFSHDDLMVHAGSLHQDTIQECSRLLRKSWNKLSDVESIQPVHLQTSDRNHLLHSSLLAVNIILALAYDAQIPYSTIRGQARHLTCLLKNPQLASGELHLLPKWTNTSTVQNPLWSGTADSGRIPRTVEPSSTSGLKVPETWEIRSSFGQISSKDVSIPTSPDPMIVDRKSPSNHPVRGSAGPAHTGLANKSPNKKQNLYSLSSAGTALCGVYFACVLVPRIKSQSLGLELAEYLEKELPDLFLAYGWRLDALEIRRTHLQWMARIPPNIAPADHIDLVRKQTSEMLLSNFSVLNQSRLLYDFWAPGFLLASGQRLIPYDVVDDFIQMNRMQYYSEESLNVARPYRDRTRNGQVPKKPRGRFPNPDYG